MIDRTCVICAAPLVGRQRKFCGQTCSTRAADAVKRSRPDATERRRRYQRAWAQRVGVSSTSVCPTKVCPQCGGQGVGYQFTFCSRECAGIARRGDGPSRQSLCPECHREFGGTTKFCSAVCRAESAHRRAAAQRGPLARALEADDWGSVAAALLDRTDLSGSCRLWTGRSRNSYGRVRAGTKEFATHRLMALAVRGGEDLGHMPVHHMCANSLCIEPSHLQVVSPEENTAEMLERTHYLARIHSLEQALAAAAPSHPLLRQ